MRIIRKGNPIKERTYLVMIDVFILMCAMGVSLGILFITISPAFGLRVGDGRLPPPLPSVEFPLSVSFINSIMSNIPNFEDFDNFKEKVKSNYVNAVDSTNGLKYYLGQYRRGDYVRLAQISVRLGNVEEEGTLIIEYYNQTETDDSIKCSFIYKNLLDSTETADYKWLKLKIQ